MGNLKSKDHHLRPPETPQYVKYAHLKQLIDGESPMRVQRTPLYTLPDTLHLSYPCSPAYYTNHSPTRRFEEKRRDFPFVSDIQLQTDFNEDGTRKKSHRNENWSCNFVDSPENKPVNIRQGVVAAQASEPKKKKIKKRKRYSEFQSNDKGNTVKQQQEKELWKTWKTPGSRLQNRLSISRGKFANLENE